MRKEEKKCLESIERRLECIERILALVDLATMRNEEKLDALLRLLNQPLQDLSQTRVTLINGD